MNTPTIDLVLCAMAGSGSALLTIALFMLGTIIRRAKAVSKLILLSHCGH